MKKRRSGFTLVELMVVIVIMAILAAAATPVFTGYVRRAKATAHLAECRSIYVAVQTYLEEVRTGKDGDVLELADVDSDSMIKEVMALTGIDGVGIGRRDMKGRDLPEDFYIELDDSRDGVMCTAVIYNGGSIWIFDTAEGSYSEIK